MFDWERDWAEVARFEVEAMAWGWVRDARAARGECIMCGGKGKSWKWVGSFVNPQAPKFPIACPVCSSGDKRSSRFTWEAEDVEVLG